MSDKNDKQTEPRKTDDVLWTFRCKGCGFMVVKLINDIERCPMCNDEFTKTFYQY